MLPRKVTTGFSPSVAGKLQGLLYHTGMNDVYLFVKIKLLRQKTTLMVIVKISPSSQLATHWRHTVFLPFDLLHHDLSNAT